MFKRDRFVFVSNLKDITCDPTRPMTHVRDAYLLSERYTNATMLGLARFARLKKNTLFSDNGNFTRMCRVAKRFEKEGMALLRAAESDGLTPEVRAGRQSLWERVTRACEEELARQDLRRIVGRQLKMNPHAMIGLEDLTIPVLQMIGLLQPELAPRAREIAAFQRRTRALFRDEVGSILPQAAPSTGVVPYMVLHAYDYSSAAQAGRSVRRAGGVDAIAISYGAAMRSQRWISELNLGRRILRFSDKLPEKYLLCQALTRGALEGAGRKVRVHLLGVGSPIMVVLSALFLPRTVGISLDSTSPFMDADDGVIYGSRHAFLKMKMYKLATALLIEGRPYESRQPFWREFDRKYPSNWPALRETLGVTSASDPTTVERVLQSEQALVRRYIPYFTRMRAGSDPFFRDLRIARAGSNYWVLKEAVEAARRLSERPSALYRWIESECARYEKHAAPKWAMAVREAMNITR